MNKQMLVRVECASATACCRGYQAIGLKPMEQVR